MGGSDLLISMYKNIYKKRRKIEKNKKKPNKTEYNNPINHLICYKS